MVLYILIFYIFQWGEGLTKHSELDGSNGMNPHFNTSEDHATSIFRMNKVS